MATVIISAILGLLAIFVLPKFNLLSLKKQAQKQGGTGELSGLTVWTVVWGSRISGVVMLGMAVYFYMHYVHG